MSLFQIELKNGERRGGDMFIRADCLKPVISWMYFSKVTPQNLEVDSNYYSGIVICWSYQRHWDADSACDIMAQPHLGMHSNSHILQVLLIV